MKNDFKSSTDYNSINIYIDGACSGNPGPGGWGVLIKQKSREKELWGSEPETTTNNRMELMAAIKALECLERLLKRPRPVNIYTDSMYVIGGITDWIKSWKEKNWRTPKNKLVMNQDLWKQLEELAQQHDLQWRHVKGHSGNQGNERADRLAHKAIKEM